MKTPRSLKTKKKKVKNAWVKVKLTRSKAKAEAEWYADFLCWTTCPHCKKVMISGSPEIVGALKQWYLDRLKTKKNARRKKS